MPGYRHFFYWLPGLIALFLLGWRYPPLLVIASLSLFFWILLDFRAAVFFLAAISICQSKVGVSFHTGAGVIIGSIFLLEIFAPVFFCSALFRACRTTGRAPRRRRPVRGIILLLAVFVAWTGFSILVADWTVRATLHFLHTLVFFLYLLVISSFTRKEISFLMGCFVFWGVVYSLLIFLSVSGVALEMDAIRLTRNFTFNLSFFPGRPRGAVLSPPAITAATLALCAWCAYYFAVTNRKRRRIMAAYGAAAFLITVGFFCTRTRSEMAGFFLAGSLLILLLSWPRKRLARGLGFCVAYVILVWLAAAGTNLPRQLQRIQVAADRGEAASLGIRLRLWEEGAASLVRTRGIGTGTGSTFYYRARWPHAHNVFLSVLFELGLFGFSAWILAYIGTWLLLGKTLFRLPPYSCQWTLLVFLGAFFLQLSVSSLLQHQYTHFIWWLGPGIILAVLNHNQETSVPEGIQSLREADGL